MYTNYLTRKQLYFALEICELLKERYPEKYKVLYEKCSLSPEELDLWKRAADNMYIGYNKELDIYTQDDQFLYRDPVDIEWLAKNKYPLLHNFHPLNLWRMQVCKQADIVLLMFLYGYEFDKPMIKRIFDYYEPRTIHDSSLSASIHSIVAMDIGYVNESYNYLKQSCRMDLDNYNRNVEHGIHAACCGAAFMMIVNGYGGMRVYDNMLHFTPRIDRRWNYCKFKILFAGSRIEVKINKKTTVYTLLEGEGFKFKHNSSLYKIDKDNKVLELNNEIMEKF
jgi:alpha,alpha-trehalose phosphorylase